MPHRRDRSWLLLFRLIGEFKIAFLPGIVVDRIHILRVEMRLELVRGCCGFFGRILRRFLLIRIRKNSSRLTAQLEAVLGTIDVLALEAPVDAVYGVIRASLERTGQPIGANDLLIAAHAMTLGHAVVTDNEREFLRIDDLRVENWLR